MLNVQESFDHKVLPLEDEALPQLLNCVPIGVWILTQLNVISCADLTLLLDFLSFNLIAHFLTICECVVFTNFSKDVCLTNCSCEECLLELESLNFHALWHVEFRVRLVYNEEILPGQTGREWHSDKGENFLENVVYFHFETFLCVLYDSELRVSNPSLN